MENTSIERILALFYDYAAIPHPSGNTAVAARWVAETAKEAGAEAEIDGTGNVFIRVPATAGYEDHPTVILQGHLDMVAAKEPDSPRDPEKEGLLLFREGDLLGARGTTLGGDDGVAVVMFLALLSEKDAAHPALEILLTVDEETGMDGADGFDASKLNGRLLLNLDSEEEGILTAGCAGGTKMHITYPVCREIQKGRLCTLKIAGASGGHSGMEIIRGGMNANHELAGILARLASRLSLSLVSLSGGDKDNAIPTHATATFLIGEEEADALLLAVTDENARLAKTYGATDPHFTLSLDAGEVGEHAAIGEEASRRYLDFLAGTPCGVQKMSPALAGLVQTSLNLGVLRNEKNAIVALWSLRSSVRAEKEELAARLSAMAEAIGAPVCREGDYPAWEYRENSPLRDVMTETYRTLFGAEMQTVVIHAGLECGIFSSRLPDLDCVSFGPNMYDIHTTRERLSVSSVERTYRYLLAVLRAI